MRKYQRKIKEKEKRKEKDSLLNEDIAENRRGTERGKEKAMKGVVTDYDATTKMYTVTFEDNEKKDFSEIQLIDKIELFNAYK